MTTPNIVIVLSDYNNETILWVQPYMLEGKPIAVDRKYARPMVKLFQETVEVYGYIYPSYSVLRLRLK